MAFPKHPSIAALCLLSVIASPAFAKTPVLPDKVPVPQVHAPPAGNIPPKHLGDTPVPEPRPDKAVDREDAEQGTPTVQPDAAATEETPATAPLPQEAPAGQRPAKEPGAKPAKDADGDPRSAEKPALLMPPVEIACRQRLRDLGIAFDDHPAESDPSGCSLPYPITVRTLGDVALEPPALMSCAMAEAAAQFTSTIIVPAAKREFGTGLKSISQASAYVCRPRNGTTKLSEHAFGNALDIASFKLSDGKTVDVILRPEEREARFLGALRKAACGPFKTVLGPGSNADHATHFHLDLAPRRNGGTVCE